jgi:hypothetical protein
MTSNNVFIADFSGNSNTITNISLDGILQSIIPLPYTSSKNVTGDSNNVWVLSTNSFLQRISVSTQQYVGSFDLFNNVGHNVLGDMYSDGSNIWIANTQYNEVIQVDATDGTTIIIPNIPNPGAITGDGSTRIWGSAFLNQLPYPYSYLYCLDYQGNQQYTVPYPYESVLDNVYSDGIHLWVNIGDYNGTNVKIIQLNPDDGTTIINSTNLFFNAKSYCMSSDDTNLWASGVENIYRIDISSGLIRQTFPNVLNSQEWFVNCISTNGTNVWATSYYDSAAIELLPLPPPCFKADTKIYTDKGYRRIQDLRKGDLVKTSSNKFVPIFGIGTRDMYHPASTERIPEQLYLCSQDQFPEVFEDLVVTGYHAILKPSFANKEEEEKTKEIYDGKICITEYLYRIPACVESRTKVYETPGTYPIYHLALENDDYYMNYGINANGLWVETCSKRYLLEFSGMELIG